MTRDDLYSQYSDLHKEIYGVRARFAAQWTAEELHQGIEQLLEEADAERAAPTGGNGWRYDGDPRALEF